MPLTCLKTEVVIYSLKLKPYIGFFLEPQWSTVVRLINEKGDMENAVTGARNPPNDRHDISCGARMNKVCTCQMYTAYTESGCSLLTLNLHFQAQATLAADWECHPGAIN